MRPLIKLLSLSAILTAASQAQVRAELILDDFNDPAQTVSPAMEGEYVTTAGVGDLNAIRKIRIADSQAQVFGSLDADITTPSALTANLDSHVPDNSQSRPLFSYQFNYEFSAVDISQGESNNALLFDFLSIEGTESPLFLQFGVWDDPQPAAIFLGRIINVPFTSSPYVAVFPFSDFTTRAGTPALPDFTTISRIEFSFFFLRPSADIKWSATLDSIRFGQVPIPEPNSLSLVISAVSVLTYRHRRAACHRRIEGCVDEPLFGSFYLLSRLPRGILHTRLT